MKISLALTAVAVGIASVSQAQTERDLDSHVHGLATMNIALTDTEAFIELNSPWNNLVGFEHSPNTEDQKALVEDALEKLRQPDLIFNIAGGDCTVSEVAVESSMLEEGHDDHKDGHDDDHDDDHKDGHDDHAHDAEESGTHSAALVTYSYQCKNSNEIETIAVNVFSLWSGFTDLDVQFASNRGQALIELNPESPVINVDKIQ